MSTTTKNLVKHRVDMTLVEVSALPRMHSWRALVQDKDGDQVIMETSNITPDGPGTTKLCDPSTLDVVSGAPINPPIIPGERYWSLERGEAFDGDDYLDRDSVIGKTSLENLAPFVKLGGWERPTFRRILTRNLNQSPGADFGTNDIRSVGLSEVKAGDLLVVADKATYAGFVEFFCGTVYTTDGKLALEPLFSLRSLNGIGARNDFARTVDPSHRSWATIMDLSDHRQWFTIAPKIYTTPGGDDPTDHMINVPKAQAENNQRSINELEETLHDLAEEAGWCEQFDNIMDSLGLDRRPEPEKDWRIRAEATGTWTDDSPSSRLDEFVSDEQDGDVTISTRKVEYTGTVEYTFVVEARKSDLDEILNDDFLQGECPIEFDTFESVKVLDQEEYDD